MLQLNPSNTIKVTAREIIGLTQNYIKSLGIDPDSLSLSNYRHFIRTFAEQYQLRDRRELEDLASHIDIKWFPPDSSIPHSYVPSICFRYNGIKYTNPEDPKDFTVFVSCYRTFKGDYVMKHTRYGYQDISYFVHFVPLLADISEEYRKAVASANLSDKILPKKKDAILRNLQEQFINSPLNKAHKEGMCLTKHEVIHRFFNQYVPGIDGICPKCFKLFLPKEGFGTRWEFRDTQHETSFQEVRLSVPKINSSHDSHKVLYITHMLTTDRDKIFRVAFNGIHYVPRTDSKGEVIESQIVHKQLQNQEFDLLLDSPKMAREPSVHIPYDIYNNFYLKIIKKFSNISKQEFKICHCKK